MLDKLIEYLETEMDKTNNIAEWHELSLALDRAKKGIYAK